MGQSQQAHDTAANIATADSVARIAKPLSHQLREQLGGAERLHPAREIGMVRETKAR